MARKATRNLIAIRGSSLNDATGFRGSQAGAAAAVKPARKRSK
jgi:hypothetical protein